MRKLQIFLLLGSLFITTGCPKYRPKVDFENPGTFVSKLNAHMATEQAKYNCYRLGQFYSAAGCTGSNPDGPARARIIRNDLLEMAIPYIDSAYIDFITDLQAGRDRTNFIADLVELGATAAVGITNGERTLQIMGVALTAFRGGRRSADLNFYKEQSTPVLITKMDGNRANVRATILAREKVGIADYPIGSAIADLVDYYNAGTLVRAFTELQKDTAVETKKSENNVLLLKGVAITPEATLETRNPAVAASDILNDLLLSQLNDPKPAVKVAATTRLQKIVQKLEQDKDAAAALKNAKVSSTDTDGTKLRRALVDIRRAAALVNNAALLATINRAIVDSEEVPVVETPTPTPTPTPSPTSSPKP